LSRLGVGVAVAFVKAVRVGVGAVDGDFDEPAAALGGDRFRRGQQRDGVGLLFQLGGNVS
jgi:hypothetical protein